MICQGNVIIRFACGTKNSFNDGLLEGRLKDC